MLASKTNCAMLLTMALALWGCEKKEAPMSVQRDTRPVPVRVGKPKTLGMQRTVPVWGSLSGNEEATISAKVCGRIAAIYTDMGERISGGEMLAQIEKADYELAANQKQLAMREALSKLGLDKLPGDDFDLSRVLTVQRAKLQVENTDAKLKRGQKLHDQNPPLITEQDFADLRTAAAVAWKNYDVELLNAQTFVAEAKARKADLDVANKALADTTIRAPRSAVVAAPSAPVVADPPTAYVIAQRLVAIGEYVKEDTPLFRLVEIDPIKLRALAAERYAAEIATGQKVRVNVHAYPGENFWGKVSRINPQVDAANRTFQVEVIIPNPKAQLKPGGFAEAWVQTLMDAKVIFVPQEAVVTFAGVSKVYVNQGGKAAEIVVETGRQREKDIEIVRGLRGDESVIISLSNRLAGGVPVVVSE